jgi:hypothetical protein
MPKEYAKRFPTDTAIEVYTPDNPPPGGDETDPLSVKKDGSATTTATIPFAEGITIKAGKKLILDGA